MALLLKGGVESPFSIADPGDIYMEIARVPPPAHLSFRNDPILTERILSIQGLDVKCLHVNGGVFIRKDDYEDIKEMLLEALAATPKKLSEKVLRLVVRSFWEGQSFVRVGEFRGGNNKTFPPYHESRLVAVQCEFNSI
jgi:hypothetical protein